MKRFIAALLAGLTLFTLVGCSGGSKADSSTPKDYSQIILSTPVNHGDLDALML